MVQIQVPTVSAMTHSYTVMPLIRCTGELVGKLFLVFAEKSGSFPQRGVFEAPNVHPMANTSHIMTKGLMATWVREVLSEVLHDGQKVLLLLDSWSGWKDKQTIRQNITKNIELTIEIIPAGCTGFIQPCDIYLFRPWKTFFRRINDFILLDNIDIELHSRDNSIKIQSLIYNKFQAPRFVNFLKYSWVKAGYYEEDLGEFDHPVRFCLDPSSFPSHCYHCMASVIIKCAWCEKHLCFVHFFKQYHIHNE